MRLKLVLTVTIHLLHQKTPTCRTLQLPTSSCSYLARARGLSHQRTEQLQSEAADNGAVPCPQESHSLLVASLPCKQRPWDVKTHRWIFICCHGITFCWKRDSGTQSSLKTGKTTQWIYQMSRAWSLSPRPVFSVLLCHPSTRAKPPTSQQLDNSHVSCRLTTYTKVNTHKKVLERKDHSAAQSRDAEGNCHCYEKMTMRMKNLTHCMAAVC